MLACLALVGLGIISVRADDWPGWRGPNRDGVWSETGILESFPAEGLKIRWRVPVGPGWSSPVISQGRVFTMDAQLMPRKAFERVLCFDEATGKELWKFSYDVSYPEWALNPEQGGKPSSTPIVDAGKVFAVGSSGQVHCLDALSGARIWDVQLAKQYKIAELSVRSSPLIDSRLLIVFTGGKPGASVVALDKNSGKEVWKALDDTVSNSSPIVIDAGGKKQLIVWTDESVASLDPLSGRTYWRERVVTSNNDSIPTPVVGKDQLLVSGLMLKLDRDKPAASVLWPDTKAASRRILSNTSTPLLFDDHVYSARSNGELVCLDAKTGKQLWQTDKVTEIRFGASINLTPNGTSVFLFTDKGDLIRARLSPVGYKEISRTHLIEPTNPLMGKKFAWTPLSFANRHVFARNDKELIRASLEAKSP